MSESVLAQFGQLLDQFDAAVSLGKAGRTARKGGSGTPAAPVVPESDTLAGGEVRSAA